MTANERNVLVALMHPANSVNHRQAGAIRSALAEIDALNEALGCERSRVANLVSRITGKPGDTTNEAVGEASREALALRKAKDRLDAIDREAEFTHPQPTLDEAQALAVLMQGAAALARNPETREMAQRMADAVNALKEHGGRARKATIDVLHRQVATLTAERDEALARAIPAEWVERAALPGCKLAIEFSDPAGSGYFPVVKIDAGRITSERLDLTEHPTLRAALDAAAKGSP